MDKEKIDAKIARFHNGVTYTLTINPDDSMQHHKGYNRWVAVRGNVMDFLKEYTPYISDLRLYPDISFPTALRAGTYPRVHYHGTITFSNILEFLIQYAPSSRFSVEIDTIENSKTWSAYCEKLRCLHKTLKQYEISLKDILGMKASAFAPPEKVTMRELLAKAKNMIEESDSESNTDSD